MLMGLFYGRLFLVLRLNYQPICRIRSRINAL